MTTPRSLTTASTRRDHVDVRWLHRRIFAILLPILIAGVAVAIWSRRAINPQLLWNEGQNALKSGDLATAQSKLDRIAGLRKPTDFDWSLRAQIAVASNRPDDALEALSHIPVSDRLAGQAFLMAGRIERQRNRIPAAERNLRKAIACEPGLIDAHKELIFILGMQRRHSEVDAEFKALSRLAPLSHHELLTWGLTHFTVSVADSASQLEAFIQADPDDRYSRLSLASVFLNTPGMQSQVEKLLEPLAQTDAAAAALRIELRLNQGRTDEAIQLLERTPGDDPALARIRGRLAILRHDHPAAIRHFQLALSQVPYDRVSLTELGRSLLLSGNKSAAEVYLTRAKRLDEVYDLFNWVRRADQENQQSDLTRFGRACEAAGFLDEARGWYLLAIGRDPLDDEAQKGVARLRALGAT